MKEKLMHWHYAKKETRLAFPGERLILSDPIAAHCVEGLRSFQIKGQYDAATRRWQRLCRRDACGDVTSYGARMNERAVAERLYELESRCRGSGSDPCACDY